MPRNDMNAGPVVSNTGHRRKPKGPLPVEKVILTRKFRNTLYELAVRTNTDAVFDAKYKYTVTEMLEDITNALITNFKNIAALSESFDKLMKDCPEEFDTLKEIADYINIHGDPKSELIELIDTKVTAEEGKGLSTHDLTDLLFDKLTNDYTKEELDEKFEIVETEFGEVSARVRSIEDRISEIEVKSNIEIAEEPDPPVKDDDVWFQLDSEYSPQ